MSKPSSYSNTTRTSQSILNDSFDETTRTIVVQPVFRAADGSIVFNVPNRLEEYETQALDDYTTTNVSYVCKMNIDGDWLFVKIDETGNFPTFTYANVSNNDTMTTYSAAYASRTTLTYGLLNTISF